MKKEWARPLAIVQNFVPNEYVAACGDSGTTYKFVCDATKDWGLIDGGEVYLETNGNAGLQTWSDQYLGGYHHCNATHEVTVAKGESVDDVFLDGYFKPAGLIDTSVRQVKVWTDGGTNIHCTKNLNINSWETTKS